MNSLHHSLSLSYITMDAPLKDELHAITKLHDAGSKHIPVDRYKDGNSGLRGLLVDGSVGLHVEYIGTSRPQVAL